MLDLFNVLVDSATTNTACSSALGADIPDSILNIVHYVYLGVQIIVPILLIIFGMIELAKAITAQKEDEIKKAQGGLLKKAIVAVVVFLVFSLVQFVFNFASADLGNDKANVWNCVNCFIGGPGDENCTKK